MPGGLHYRRRDPRSYWRARTWARLAALIGLAVSLVAASMSVAHTAGSAAAAPVTYPLIQPTVPNTGIYAGGFIDPTPTAVPPSTSRASGDDEIAALPAFDSGLARPLSIVQLFGTWTAPVYSSQIYEAAASGAIPMVDWQCDAASTGLVPAITGGTEDTYITGYAQQLAATHLPLLLRFFPDANSGTPVVSSCLGGAGPAGYQAAFRRVKALFHQAGAYNVAFVWSAATTNFPPATLADPTAFYPGPSVDWIGADGFVGPTVGPSAFTSTFQTWYSEFSTKSKPLMISDTGVRGAAGDAVQAAYIGQMTAALNSFPAIKAVVYYDSTEAPAALGHGVTATIAQPGAAYSAYSSFGAGLPPAPPAASAVSVAWTDASGVTDQPVAAGAPVKLTATVAAPDKGGNLTFYSDGLKIPECSAVPVALSATCTYSWPSAGAHLISVTYSGDAMNAPASSPSAGLIVVPAATTALPPQVPAVGHSYLGAWVDPQGNTDSGTATVHTEQELTNLPSFEPGLGRPLSIVHVYQAWDQVVPDYVLNRVAASGAIPMIDWYCAKNATDLATDSDIAGGVKSTADTITQYATHLAHLGFPVFLRWYWEPNFTNSSTAATCLNGPAATNVPLVDGTTGNVPQLYGAKGYVAAFRAIHDLFQRAGATNVSFVWSMGSAGNDQDMMNYFPGPKYVDWIAEDAYWRTATDPDLGHMYGTWYSYFASFGLPLMISETGAVRSTIPGGADVQTAFLNHAADALAPAGTFPLIRAFVYFDALRDYGPTAGGPAKVLDYSLPDGSPGRTAFNGISSQTTFQPPRSAANLVLPVATPALAAEGQEVAIATPTPAPDHEGALTFTDTLGGQTSPLAGCTLIAISLTSECDTDTLAPGTHLLSVSYGGDAEYAPATAGPVVVIVGGPPPVHPAHHKPVVPDNSVYLGAYVNSSPGSGVAGVLQGVGQLQASIGPKPRVAIVSIYAQWGQQGFGGDLRRIMASGSIPEITWECGVTDADVVSGAADSAITRFAQSLAAVPGPIFLRWAPDPNLPTTPTAQNCLGAQGAHGYQAAFQHIHDLFALAGASNVAFVWSVAVGTGASVSNLASYFPGRDYVDWIGADGYADLTGSRTTGGKPFVGSDYVHGLWSPWYDQFSSYGKPMIIDTGAIAADQTAGYFPSLFATLSGAPAAGSAVNPMPGVRALVYDDSPSWFAPPGGTPTDYTLTPGAGEGLAAFDAAVAGVATAFETQRSAAPVTLTASSTVVAPGHGLSLVATVPASDGAGTVTFLLGGQPVPYCQGIVLLSEADCTMYNLPSGAHDVTAAYSGDAVYMASVSNAVPVTALAIRPGTGGSQGGGGSPGGGSPGGGSPGSGGAGGGSTTGPGGSGPLLSFAPVGLVFTDQPTIGAVAAMAPAGLEAGRASVGGAPAGAGGVANGVVAGGTTATAGSAGGGPVFTGSGSGPAALTPPPVGSQGTLPANVVLFVGLGVAFACLAYIVSTWVGDRRRRSLPSSSRSPGVVADR